jgi:sugar/nucleoside kinase (ribokinase family)
MGDILILGTVGRELVHSFGTTSGVVFGGTAYYAIEAVLRAGATQPLLVSALGNDISVRELVRQFSAPINSSGLQENPRLPSFYWEARYDTSFEESTTLALENRVINEFVPDWAALAYRFPSIRFCYLAAYDPQVQLACARHFAKSLVVSETLQYWIGRDRDGVLEVARHSNGFVVTDREFSLLWNISVPLFAPHALVWDVVKAFGLDFLIITFGDRGSQVFDAEGTFVAPALSCETIDSTGAGNAFSGGIVGHLAYSGGYDRARLQDAVALGTGLASLQVRDFSNRALRTASSSEIQALHLRARDSIRWCETKVGKDDPEI